MPDVGVLNLQIRDDSAKAAEGLGRLASSLKRVQQALGSEQRLSSMAGYIKKLNEAVTKAIPEESINRLERLATAVDKISKAGGLNIKGLKGLETATKAAEKVKSTVGDSMADGFEHVDSKVQQTKETIQETVQATKELYKATNQVRQATGHMSQYNPKTGKFEATPFANTREWMEDQQSRSAAAREAYNESRSGSFASARAREMAEAREKFADSTDKTKKIVANAFGMEVDEMFPKAATIRESVGAMQEMSSAVQGVAEAAQASGNSMQDVSSSMQEAGKKAISFKDRMRDAWSALRGDGEDDDGAKKKLMGLFESFKKLKDQFARVAKYRMIRAVLKQITDGFREGVENYRAYSEQIGSSFAPAMESATSALSQMKNAIGAAAAPVIQELIPYLKMAVSWFVTAINYVNQFFALLRGQNTWSKAVEVTGDAAEDTAKSVKRIGGAAREANEELKDLLADFDELNIIQSESGNGGYGGSGGYGGGAAKAVEETVKMFEESGSFNDTVKTFVDTIKNGFGDILKLIELAGIALLGWQFSKSFTGWMSTLGKWIAGLAVIDIGVRLSYGAGYGAGFKGKFDGADILSSITGALATAIGGYLIGGGTGAAVGLGISLFATLYGYIQGDIERKDLLKWGTDSMTPEEIKTYVDGMFDFDVKARINIAESIITVSKENREKLNSKIAMFSQSLDKVKIGVDGTPEGLREAEAAAGEVIKQLNKNMQDSQKSLEVLTKIVPVTSSNGGTAQSLIDNIKIADQTMSDYFQGLGQQIADWIDLGQQNQWKNNEAAMALALMEHQESIIKGAEDNKIHRDFEVDSDLNLSSMTRGNAQQVMSEEIARVEEYKKKVQEATEQTAKDYLYLEDVARNAGLDGAADTYKEMANSLLDSIKNGNIFKEEKVKSSLDKMRAQWIETLKRVYGGDISDQVDLRTQLNYDFFGLGGINPFIDGLKAAFGKDEDIEGVKRFVEEELSGVFNTIDPQHILRNAAQQFGFTIFDLLSPEDQGMIADSVYKAFEDEETANKILQAMGITGSAVTEKIAEEVENTAPAIGQAYQNVLNEMEAADWQHTTDAEFDNLLTSLRDKFGGDAVQEALNQLDIPQSEIRVPLSINATPEDSVSVLGVPTEGGWWNNVWDAVLGGKPLETDAKIHVDLDVDEEDLSILDVIDKGGFKNTSKVWKLGGRFSANTLGAGAAGFSNANTTPQQITVAQDDSKQKENIKGGTGDLLAELRSIVSGIQSLNRKSFTVNITPSTGLGRVNRKSSEAYAKISGDYIDT